MRSEPGGKPETEGVQVTTVAGTPSSFSHVADDATLAQLELRPALECVAAYAVGPLGAERVLNRRPSADAEWIGAELNRTRQLANLLVRGDGFRPEYAIPAARSP